MISSVSLQQLCQALIRSSIGTDSMIKNLESDMLSSRFSAVSTDTRTLQKGDLFIALRGDNFDGHNYLQQAQKLGACALVVEKECPEIKLAQVLVSDTTLALGCIAAINREKFIGPLLAITGSCGKTTVKEMLVSVLSGCGKVHATKGNFNNHIGMPLTLIDLAALDEYAVIEMGASGAGEIDYLVGLAKPSVALVNNVMAAHVEGFGSIDSIARAKAEIYHGLDESGIAIINLDDNYASDMICALSTQQHLTFSLFNSSADVYAKNIKECIGEGIDFTLCTPVGEAYIHLSVLGQHNLANALAASCCALSVGANLQDITAGLENFKAVSGRLNIEAGLHGCTVIDDSYNANPGSVCAAIDAIKNIPGEKILVLGDMAELGDEAQASHAQVGRYAYDAGLQAIYGVGPLSKFSVEAFGPHGKVFSRQSDLIELLKNNVSDDTLILVKGSRSSRMDVVAQALIHENSGVQR